MTKARKKIFLTVISTAVSVAVLGLGLELYLRRKQSSSSSPYSVALYTHSGQKISSAEGSLKLSLAPFTIYKNLPSQRTSTFTINSHGLRGEDNLELDAGPRIIFLGGSAAFGMGAENDQETIPYMLGQSIKPYRVLNGGVVGFQSGQELTYLVTELIDYRPAIVMTYDGWNDLFDSIYAPRKENELGFNSNFFRMEEELALNYQTQVSPYKSLGRLVEATSTRSLLLTRVMEKIRGYNYQRPTLQKTMLDAAAQNYATNIRKMSLISHAVGAQFIVVFQPELGLKLHPTPAEQEILAQGIVGIDSYHDEFPELYRQFLAKAKQLLDRDKIEWVDINESTEYQQSSDGLFVDVVHTNRRGNQVVAEIISPRLRVLADHKPAEGQ